MTRVMPCWIDPRARGLQPPCRQARTSDCPILALYNIYSNTVEINPQTFMKVYEYAIKAPNDFPYIGLRLVGAHCITVQTQAK